jgi:hypothetical protein
MFYCTQKQPEEIFYSLVAGGLEKTKAEPLGLTFGLDLLHLYELAADAYFAEGQDARALEYVIPVRRR